MRSQRSALEVKWPNKAPEPAAVPVTLSALDRPLEMNRLNRVRKAGRSAPSPAGAHLRRWTSFF